MVDGLGTMPSSTDPQMEASIDSYMTLIKEIHTTLAEHSHLVTNYRPFARSPYAAIKKSELADVKLQIVRRRIQEMVGEVENLF